MDWYALAGTVVALLALVLLVVSLRRGRREAARFRILEEVARVSDGSVERAAARVAPGGSTEAEQALGEREPSLPAPMVADGDDASLEPRFIERMDEAQARYTLRTAAWLSGDPLVALATLNSALLARSDSALCSVVAFALSSDAAQPVRLAVAGHLPPLLVDGEAVTEIAEARLHAELAGSASPASSVSKLEGALDLFTAGDLDDDAAALAVTPAGGQAPV